MTVLLVADVGLHQALRGLLPWKGGKGDLVRVRYLTRRRVTA